MRIVLALLLAGLAIFLRLQLDLPELGMTSWSVFAQGAQLHLDQAAVGFLTTVARLLGAELPLLLAVLALSRWRPERVPPFWLPPLLVASAVRAVRWFAFHDSLWASDEWAYQFQSEILSLGRYTVPQPPLADPFATPNLLIYQGHWSSTFSWGWPFLLALAQAVGLRDWLPALLAGLSVALLQALTERHYDRATAVRCGLLCLACPSLIFTGATLFSHLATLTAVLAMLCLPHPALAGLAWGFLLGLRPPEGVVAGLAYLVASRARPRAWLLFGLGGCPLALALAFNNLALTGVPWHLGYHITGESALLARETLPLKASYALSALARSTAWMPALWLPGLLAAVRQKDRHLLALGCFWLFYLPLFARPGLLEFGSRYLLVPVVLTLPVLAGQLARWPAALPLVLLFQLAAVYPRAFPTARQGTATILARENWMRTSFGNDALIFFRGDPDSVAPGMMHNAPQLRGQIRALFLEPELNDRLCRQFPDRVPYLLDWVDGRYQVTPYAAARDSGFDHLCAGYHLINSCAQLDRARAEWSAVPLDSPWRPAAQAALDRHPARAEAGP